MVRKRRRIRRRPSILDSLKWLPFLAIPFCALFSEAWLYRQRLAADYESNQIFREMRKIDEERNALHVETAELRKLERLETAAATLGMTHPVPGQIQVVEVDTDLLGLYEPEEHDLDKLVEKYIQKSRAHLANVRPVTAGRGVFQE